MSSAVRRLGVSSSTQQTRKRKYYSDGEKEERAPAKQLKTAHRQCVTQTDKQTSGGGVRRAARHVTATQQPRRVKPASSRTAAAAAGPIKWRTLRHNGPLFPPPYRSLPASVKFYYNGKRLRLNKKAEEVAVFYAKMMKNKATKDTVFRRNFLSDWRKVMTPGERRLIVDLSRCDFTDMYDHLKSETERRKKRKTSSREKRERDRETERYGYCVVDGRRQKIGNFRVEPPGLFCGRGSHPKRGRVKGRITASQVTINCGRRVVPRAPGRGGGRWKEVRHDQAVTWLASWTDSIQGTPKYINLDVSSTLKASADREKYETARQLHRHIQAIRRAYTRDLSSKSLLVRQRAVAVYLIDRLSLRAGNEKDSDSADTVGCCTLRVEHVTLHRSHRGQRRVVEFDFLGKDSIRYEKSVSVPERVFKNLSEFVRKKKRRDALFNLLSTAALNSHLNSLMPGLSAKVFRTYNASVTLQQELKRRTRAKDSTAAKLCAYNEANREAAVLCNHKRATPKNFDRQMKKLEERIEDVREELERAEDLLDDAKAEYREGRTAAGKKRVEQRKRGVVRLRERLCGLERQEVTKRQNKEIALGTSKLNYLDPRISVAWCRRWRVPIEQVYNKRQRDKFSWAIQTTKQNYRF